MAGDLIGWFAYEFFVFLKGEKQPSHSVLHGTVAAHFCRIRVLSKASTGRCITASAMIACRSGKDSLPTQSTLKIAESSHLGGSYLTLVSTRRRNDERRRVERLDNPWPFRLLSSSLKI